MYSELVLERMKSVYADMAQLKLIFVLRNPADRAFSHYLMTYRRGFDLLPFEEAILKEAERINGDFDDKMHFSYTSRGFYYRQIEPYLKSVGRDNILILFSEDLRKTPEMTLQQVYQFLGVDTNHLPANIHQRFHEATKPRYPHMRRFLDHAGLLKQSFRVLFPFVGLRRQFKEWLLEWNEKGHFDQKPQLKHSTRLQLNALFRDDIVKLEQLTGRELSHWKR